MSRQRISPMELAIERRVAFHFWATATSNLTPGFWTTGDLYKLYKKTHPKTCLSVAGFGRLVPKQFKRGMRRMDGKLYRGVWI